MHIEERWRCPGCGNRRRLVWDTHTYHCFNCQNKTSDWQPASFTARELARLAAYRGAVQAGVYSDEMRASGDAMLIDGAQIVRPDLEWACGVVHVIDRVLLHDQR